MCENGLRHRSTGASRVERPRSPSPDSSSSATKSAQGAGTASKSAQGAGTAGKSADDANVSGSKRAARSARFPGKFMILASSCIVAGFLLGAIVSVIGTVHVLGTYDYPALSQWLSAVFNFFDIHIDVHIPEKHISSCRAEQPLVQMKENFMDADVFSEMKECLVGHPRISKNSLNPDGFNGTRGFVIQFANDAGVKMFRDEKGFDCNNFNPLVPFFDKSRDPEANAFVINVLVCDKPSSPSDVVVGSHVDDTLAHSAPGITFLAHAVSVLYISVPPDMSGGELELLGPAPSEDVVPEDFEIQHVAPVENRMAQFRGDSYHQVRGYSTDTDVLRISLVLEQYRVAPAYQNGVDQYVESVKDGMTMM
jgi:hypothetical protein